MRSALAPIRHLRAAGGLPAAATPPIRYTAPGLRLPLFHRSDTTTQLATYGMEPTLFACVNRLANAVAQVEWRLYRKAPNGQDEDRVEVTSHAALDLWRAPAKGFYTRQQFVEVADQHLELAGESYWVIGEAMGLPISIWPVRPDRMAPVPSPTRFLAGYVYTDPDGQRIPFEPHQVIHLKYPDPLDPYHGLGPVRSLLVDLDASRYASEWNRNFFMNSAQPGGILRTELNLTDDEFDELQARWNEQHQGVANAHRVAIIEGGMEWVDRSFSMRDMEFTKLQGVSDARIMLAFGMSKTLLGQTENVNRATAEAAEYVFGKYQVVPRLRRIQEVLNTQLLPRFGERARDLEFDFDDPVSGNTEEEARDRDSRVSAVVALAAQGYDLVSLAEAFGLPDIAVAASAGGDGTLGATPREKAEMIQKLYLGVGTVVTWDEARQVLREAGMELADIPAPTPAAAQVPPGPEARLMLTRATTHNHDHHHHHHPGVVRLRPRAAGDPPDLDPDQLPNLNHLQADYDEILDQLIDQWAGIEADQKDELVDAILDIADNGSITDLADLAGMITLTPAIAALLAAMLDIGARAADHVVDEAAEQGVKVKPQPVDEGRAKDVATVVAALLAGRLAAGAAATAMRANGPGVTAAEVGQAVREHLDTLSIDTPRTQLGGALTGSQNEARLETFRKAPEAALYSNETLDRNTCPPCRAISGKWLGNISDLDEVLKLYPGGAYGGYVGCEGRERCRGTVVGVWRR